MGPSHGFRMLSGVAAALIACLLLVHETHSELSFVMNAHHPLSAYSVTLGRWRNRTVELYERLAGSRLEFSSDTEYDHDKKHSSAVFDKIYELVQTKLKSDEQRPKHREDDEVLGDDNEDDEVLGDDNDDDYFEGSPLNQGRPFSLRPCSPDSCMAKFTLPTRTPYNVPCSVASGFMSENPQLPMVYPGNYDLCRSFEFANAHFCTIETGFLALPIIDPNDKRLAPQPADMAVIGNILMGKCVADTCTSNALRKRFFSGVRKNALKMFTNARRLRIDLLVLESLVESTTVVHCVREAVDDQGEEHESMGTMLFFFFFGLLVVIGASASFYAHFYPNTHNKYVLSFSLTHNLTNLIAPMKGEYVFLNGVRVISMLWVVYGHTVLMSSGVGMNIPVSNPSAIDYQLQEFSMTYIRAGEYSVDTFFFMSGFLAASGIIEALDSGRMPGLKVSTYLSLILVRFLRLTPVYMFVLFFYVKVLPFCGTGPYWHLNVNKDFLEHSCRRWYTNLFYFNNLYPFGVEGGLNNCMGWTWYLANDMQFFLLVPFLAAFFLWQFNSMRGTRAGYLQRFLRLYGPCALLVIIQISVTFSISQHYHVKGIFDDAYSAYLYVKPWCRISPYAIGCWLAMYRFSKKNSPKPLPAEDPTFAAPRLSVYTLLKPHIAALFGFGLTMVISFVIFDDFRCRAQPESDCHVPFAFFLYGDLAPGGWPQLGMSTYLAFGYPIWGLGLAIMTDYAADGHGGMITRFLAHPVFLPMARLSYTVYLVHLICMQWFFAKAPAAVYSSQPRQVLDAFGFAAMAFVVALVLYLLVEKPLTSLLPWCFGFDKEEKRTQRTQSVTMPLNRELSLVSDVDSESVIIVTPTRRASIDLQEPLVRRET